MIISMLTVHDAASARKVDFHFWADVLVAQGHQVNFVTVGLSPITQMKSGGRRYARPYNVWTTLGNTVRRFVWYPLFHPFGSGRKWLDKITGPLFSLYPDLMSDRMLEGMRGTDVFIIENGAGLLLVPRLKQKFPDSKFVYNVCDRIETLGYHPIIVEAEKKASPLFDFIRVPAEIMVHDFGNGSHVGYIPHGLDKSEFTIPSESPYKTGRNVVSVGDMLFDEKAIATMAMANPDWTFHLFGKNAFLSASLQNVKCYGERPFHEIVPYIRYADIGLAPYRPAMNADYLSQSSMKMIQYTFCQLPIVAPEFAATGRKHVAGYRPDDEESIRKSVLQAAEYNRETIDTSVVMGWQETVEQLLSGAGMAQS
ncbi:MAG: hypothetical protein KC713_10830 [Candidatus Omnitrophica bacterium]|nr:hypothetical protein [Candidatus Omnitrophota bacterium]